MKRRAFLQGLGAAGGLAFAPTLGAAAPAARGRAVDRLRDAQIQIGSRIRMIERGSVQDHVSVELGGFGEEPPSPIAPRFLTLGGFAVAGFFALSGLLVGRSAMRRDTATFARARAVRILPAYWVALLVSAFGAGLLGWVHDGGSIGGYLSADADGPFAYIGRAALLPIEFVHGIFDVFAASTPFGSRGPPARRTPSSRVQT